MRRMDAKSLSIDEIESFFSGLGEPRFRARQVVNWLFVKGADNFDQMTNLPLGLRARLAELLTITVPVIAAKRSTDGGLTVKYLFQLTDGEKIETVLMHRPWGRTVCVSSQVGCRMGCRFCASGKGGLIRNLSPGELYDQVLFIQKDTGLRPSHIVLMGTGEPFDNLDNTLRFLRTITHPASIGIGARHITLSTCGVVPGIHALAELGLQVGLAVSIHAPNDRLRDRLVPVNRRYPLRSLIGACREFCGKTGRRVTFEYTLIAGENDGAGEARELAELLKGLSCHVNLIPLNRVTDRRFEATPPERVKLFKKILEKEGLVVTTRREVGGGIAAACGQLRCNYREPRLMVPKSDCRKPI
ncbi:MAG: 23S rRNA (adenine(2503)-C(2))-methyltransferase RlmN [Ammonifex sp.]|nr:MAG: 23S rRNA (adenine(2503)-C(2))-methyltransferase RlmN [Ammonifex sp.]